VSYTLNKYIFKMHFYWIEYYCFSSLLFEKRKKHFCYHFDVFGQKALITGSAIGYVEKFCPIEWSLLDLVLEKPLAVRQ